MTSEKSSRKVFLSLQVGLLAAVALVLAGIFISSFIPPSIVLGKSFIVFAAQHRGATTGPQTISIVIKNKPFGGHRDLHWKARPQDDWLVVKPSTGRGAGEVEIRPRYGRLSPGTHETKLDVTAEGVRNSPQEVLVAVNIIEQGASAPPFGWVDYPADGERVTGNFLDMWGWALDDIEVREVRIKRSPFPGETAKPVDPDGLIHVGIATFFKGMRPDVARVHADYPLNDRAGWQFRFPLRGFLSEGRESLILHVFFVDKEGHIREMTPRTVRLAR
ncbi:MAG: hypothetical protein QHH14_13410 [Clostridiales bacterium]|nr:hypothetical protein [Clostridiales bacterium]